MIKDFTTYIREGLFDRNQSEFNIRKTDRGVEQVYIPKTKEELHKYIELDIEQAKKDGTYPNVDLNNIDVSELGDYELTRLYTISGWGQINPDISNWNIKYMPVNFFGGNEQIEEFTIPNGVKSIIKYDFYDCKSLKSVIIPNSVEIIGESSFSGCSGLTSMIIPNSVTSIGNSAFYNCSGLKSVIIPNSITSIEERTFCGCSSLEHITIPNSVIFIGCDAFCNCSSLSSVTISKRCHISEESFPSFPKNCKIIRRDD